MPAASAGENFQTLTAYAPVFSNFGGSIYENELVRSAIDARARAISKLRVQVFGSAAPKLQRTLNLAPNEWQTWGQFLYRLSTILDVLNTAFVVPVFNDFDEITGFYPILPSACKLVEFNGELWLRYRFSNGQTASVEFSRCAVLNRFQYQNDFFGENNNALMNTMKLINIQNQGITEGVKSSATYRFMATVSNFTNDEDLAKERKRFNRANFQSGEGGALLFPNTFKDIKQIDSRPFVVDAEQMRLIQTNVFNYFGVNEDVLQNKAYGDKWAAFYEGAVEPFSVQFSEVMTRAIFSAREQTQGNYLMATSNRLQFMTATEKLQVSAQMADRGILSRNEIREIWNLPSIEGMGDTFPVRGEYYNLGEDQEKNQEE